LNTAKLKTIGNVTTYVYSSSLNAVEDKKNTGLTAAEEEKANSPISYYLNETFKSIAKGIGVYKLTQAAVGEDLETGKKKSVTERWVDFADGVVTAVSMGRMGLTARLKTWAKDAARDAIADKSIPMLMDILGIKDQTERAVFGYYMLIQPPAILKEYLPCLVF